MANNFDLNGDEARLLMAALAQSEVVGPSSWIIKLYVRLFNISNAQPPKQEDIKDAN